MAQSCDNSSFASHRAAHSAVLFLTFGTWLAFGLLVVFSAIIATMCIAALWRAARCACAAMLLLCLSPQAHIRAHMWLCYPAPSTRAQNSQRAVRRMAIRRSCKCKKLRLRRRKDRRITCTSPPSGPSPAPSLPADALCSLQLPTPIAGAEALWCKQDSISRSSRRSSGSWAALGSLRCCSAPASPHSATTASPSSTSTITTDSSSCASIPSMHSLGFPTWSSPSPSPSPSTPPSCPSPASSSPLPSAFGLLPFPACSELLAGVDQEALLAQLSQAGAGAAAAAGGFGAFYPAHVSLPSAAAANPALAAGGVLLGLKAILPPRPSTASTPAATPQLAQNPTTTGDVAWEVGCHAAAQAASPLVVRLYHAHLGSGSSVDDGDAPFKGALLWQELGLMSGAGLCEQLLLGNATLSTAQLTHIAACLLAAVTQLWERGVAHGDLKPHNFVLVGKNLTPKLCDFGMARLRHPRTGEWAGVWGGTPWYLPAEAQLYHSAEPELDLASELYCVGVSLVQLARAGAGKRMTAQVFEALQSGEYEWAEECEGSCLDPAQEGGEYLASLLMGLTSTCPAIRLDTATRCAGHACFDPCDDSASPYPDLLLRGDGQGLADLRMPDAASLMLGFEPADVYQGRASSGSTLQL